MAVSLTAQAALKKLTLGRSLFQISVWPLPQRTTIGEGDLFLREKRSFEQWQALAGQPWQISGEASLSPWTIHGML